MKFIDEVKIVIGSGNGGPGCVSFRRETHVPRGGPDGGDGGRGGHLVFEVDDHLNSLIDFRMNKKYIAGNGLPGEGQNRTGCDGEDMVLKVPRGTIVREVGGDLLADMSDTERGIMMEGGLGGKGNCFYKSSVHQAPQIAQKGLPGERREVVLELKLIADVGLLGFPNAGKSTLISRLSAAKPKIADYPFTTLTPNLGVVKIEEGASFVIADIPGLVPGAHEGVGLGTQFLRHIERTKAFVHVVDGSEFTGRDPIEDYIAINAELAGHDKNSADREGYMPLSRRTQILVINKSDTLSAEKVEELKEAFEDMGLAPLIISAVTGYNLDELIRRLSELVLKQLPGESEEEPI